MGRGAFGIALGQRGKALGQRVNPALRRNAVFFGLVRSGAIGGFSHMATANDAADPVQLGGNAFLVECCIRRVFIGGLCRCVAQAQMQLAACHSSLDIAAR